MGRYNELETINSQIIKGNQRNCNINENAEINVL